MFIELCFISFFCVFGLIRCFIFFFDFEYGKWFVEFFEVGRIKKLLENVVFLVVLG